MKNLATFIITAVGVFMAGHANAADVWTPRLICDHSVFVVDGFHTDDRGFVNHQIVIRYRGIIDYFSQLIGKSLEANERGELVRSLETNQFNGEFTVTLMDVRNVEGPSGTLYSAHGHWIDSGQYEIYVTQLSHYPGMTYHQPAYLGKWVFDVCTQLR